MMHALVVKILKHFHLFCGMGGAARGGEHVEVSTSAGGGELRARFRCIGGVDVSPPAVAAFSRYVGVPATLLDLFSREQYVAFHGEAPPHGWRQAVAEDLRLAAGGEAPDIICSSPPCKGWSGLVTEARSRSPRYQALNALTVRGIGLALDAWADDPPSFWLLENVPRLVSRGAELLGTIVAMLEGAGYAVAYTIPDLGEVGNLAQSRKRLHLVARHREKVPVHIFEPPRRPLRAVGDVLGPLPLPGHPAGGPLHRLPRLEWRTWVRLALIPPGGDWRDLNLLAVEDGVLRDYRIEPGATWHPGVLGVTPWGEPAKTMTCRGGITNGNHAVADPRVGDEWNHGALGVRSWEEHAAAVTTSGRPTSGAHAVADPRAPYSSEYGQLGVKEWDRPANTVSSQSSPGQGPCSVADPRCPSPLYKGMLGVAGWDEAAATITAEGGPTGGRHAIADPRHPGCPPEGANFERGGHYGVLGWEQAAGAVTGAAAHDNGRWSVADPRGYCPDTHHHVCAVSDWKEPARTVTGARTPGSGAGVVADPRFEALRHNNVYRLVAWRQPSVAVTAGQGPSSGGIAVQDPRLDWHAGASTSKMRVAAWREAARTITGSDRPGSGAGAVADPRSPIDDGAGAGMVLPEAGDRGRWLIQALDGTWHRPMSVLERAALQGLVDEESIERFSAAVAGMTVSGVSEVVGNAIPPPAMAETLRAAGVAILLARAGETFALGSTPVWVRPLARGVLLGGGRA